MVTGHLASAQNLPARLCIHRDRGCHRIKDFYDVKIR
jgi:hypothetical protein